MEAYSHVKFDDSVLESLEQILNLDSTSYWASRNHDASPPFPLSPESPSSPFLSASDSPDYEDAPQSPLDYKPNSHNSDYLLTQEAKKKRGRRPLRPFDPIKKKTEEKDKYWLRGFRAYMKTQYNQIRSELNAEERAFWRYYLGPGGKPEKGNVYLSYGKKYKNFLFSQRTFARLFQDWFTRCGEDELAKKCAPNSDLWFVFYDYGAKELLHYTVTELPEMPPASMLEQALPAPVLERYDITMVDADGYVDSLLCEQHPSH